LGGGIEAVCRIMVDGCQLWVVWWVVWWVWFQLSKDAYSFLEEMDGGGEEGRRGGGEEGRRG
jgi:hypothetical protein